MQCIEFDRQQYSFIEYSWQTATIQYIIDKNVTTVQLLKGIYNLNELDMWIISSSCVWKASFNKVIDVDLRESYDSVA